MPRERRTDYARIVSTAPRSAALVFVEPDRPVAIEDPSNLWLVHPLSRALLAPSIRLGIHPNGVSIAGLACGALAGVAYLHWRDPWFATLGFVLMIGWHVADGLDGKLARATGKATALGRSLDGMCDYLIFFFVLVPMALGLPHGQAMLALALALTAGAAHAAQSALYEGERTSWRRREEGVFVAAVRPPTGGPIERGYNAMERALGNRTRKIDAVLARNPRLVPRYLVASAPLVRGLGLLGANSRTLAIWLACLAGHPMWFWIWELVGLSAIGLALTHRLRAVEAGLASAAERC